MLILSVICALENLLIIVATLVIYDHCAHRVIRIKRIYSELDY